MATNRILCLNSVPLLLLLLYIWVFAWPYSCCCGLVPGEFMLQELFLVFDTQSMSYPSLPFYHFHPCISPVFTFVDSQNRYDCNAGTISHTRPIGNPLLNCLLASSTGSYPSSRFQTPTFSTMALWMPTSSSAISRSYETLASLAAVSSGQSSSRSTAPAAIVFNSLTS